ncbi:MAG: hypothetical protein AAB353_13115 [Candidatus Hydrogenedentota bacterium]
MRSNNVLLIFLFAVSSFADEPKLGEPPDIDKVLTADQWKQLEDGEIILQKIESDDKRKGGGLAVGIINAPASKLFAALSDFEEHVSYFPRMVSLDLYTPEQEGLIGIHPTIKVPIVGEVQYNVLFKLDEKAGTLLFGLDHSKTNDIADTLGAWVVRGLGNERSLFVYSVYVDTGRNVPKVLEDFLTNRDLPNVIKAVRDHLEPGK